jgi:hypothetical protein
MSTMDDVARDTSPLTPESFESLGRCLGVEWPDWYRRFMRVMVHLPLGHRFWLAGGFLFAQRMFVYDYTTRFRTGEWTLNDRTSRTAIPWPAEFVVVGTTGNGMVALDTTSEAWEFKLIDRESSVAETLFDGANLACTPEDLARYFGGCDERHSLRMQMESRMEWEAEALRTDPGRRYDSRINAEE